MSVQLRPMNLGEILDRTVQMYRTRFWLFVGVAAAPSVVVLACFAVGVLLTGLAGKGGDANNIAAVLGFVALLLVGLPLYALACGVGYAALCVASKKRYFDEPVTVREAYREALKHFWRYLGLFAMELTALGIAPFAVLFVGAIAVGAAAGAAGAGKDTLGAAIGFSVLGMCALIGIYACWLLPRLCLAFPACVVEEIGAWKSLKRGWTLSAGTRWRVLLLFVLGGVAGWMVSWIVMIPAVLVIALIPALQGPQHAAVAGQMMMVVTYSASFAVQAFIRPVYGVGLMLFYYDQRIRKEGFDIEWMMQAAGMTAVLPAIAAPGSVVGTNAGQTGNLATGDPA